MNKSFKMYQSKSIPWALELTVYENNKEIDRAIVMSEKDAILYLVQYHDFKVVF